jgi:hypothetical protein
LTWYSIVTVLFRCPATLDVCDESSPRICKPYFQIKHAVSPHLEPYYDAYAAPYVDIARPYYNTVEENVITPGWAYATKYGAPRIHQAQIYSKAQWDKTVQPQLVKYQDLAKAKYDENLSPHVERLSEAVGPYYDIARTNTLQTYHEHVLPAYQFMQPYAQHGYNTASVFATETAIPGAVWAWNKTYVFLDGTVWPQLRVIYVENVEPQLVKIGQRLGRYNGKASSQKPVVDPITRSVVLYDMLPSFPVLVLTTLQCCQQSRVVIYQARVLGISDHCCCQPLDIKLCHARRCSAHRTAHGD